MTVELFEGPIFTNWQVPPGVFSVFVECYGEGANGANGNSGEGPNEKGGQAGGGGGYGASTRTVVPGQFIPIVAGGGGSDTGSSFDGGLVFGGQGLTQFPPNHGTGVGDITDDGTDGTDGAFPAGYSAGGDGGDGGGPEGGGGGSGSGGNDGGSSGNATAGTAYGGGGGGSGGAFLPGGIGGPGAIGAVILTYEAGYLLDPEPPIDEEPGITVGDVITIPGVPEPGEDPGECLDSIISVTFNGIPAVFSIDDETFELIITVPDGVDTDGVLVVISSVCGEMDFNYVVPGGPTPPTPPTPVIICCQTCAANSVCPPWTVSFGKSVRRS